MSWLYRLQRRAGLTGPEGTAAVVLVLALAGGLAAREWQSSQVPFAPDIYAAADAAFVAASTPPLHSEGPAGGPSGAFMHPVAFTSDLRADSVGTAPTEPFGVPAAESPSDAGAIADAVVHTSAERSRAGKPPPVRTNLNTASAEQLQRLPRIGPALAERIVEHRRTNGRFRSAADITAVKGIGDRTFERLAPWIFV